MENYTPFRKEPSPTLRGKFVREVDKCNAKQRDGYRSSHAQSPDSFQHDHSGTRLIEKPMACSRSTSPLCYSYIFISSLHLPAHKTLHSHLKTALGQYKPDRVCCDDNGWYIHFGIDSMDGDRLRRCYSDLNRTQLFSRYILHMELRSDSFPSFLQNERQVTPTCSSGRTYSDSSPRRQIRCHRCNIQPSQLEPLIHCSTCSRCYHRKCHGDFSHVSHTTKSWQCGKCATKNARPENNVASENDVYCSSQELVKKRKRESDTIEVVQRQSSVQKSKEPSPCHSEERIGSLLQEPSSLHKSYPLPLYNLKPNLIRSLSTSLESVEHPHPSESSFTKENRHKPLHKDYGSRSPQLGQPLAKGGEAGVPLNHDVRLERTGRDAATEPILSTDTRVRTKSTVAKPAKQSSGLATIKCSQCQRPSPFRPGAEKQLCSKCRHKQKHIPTKVLQKVSNDQEIANAPNIIKNRSRPSNDLVSCQGEVIRDTTHRQISPDERVVLSGGLPDEMSNHGSDHDETSYETGGNKDTQKDAFKRKGKYLNLIGRAFEAHSYEPLSSKDIATWIIANTNDPDMDEDKWRSRVRAILSQNHGKGHQLWDYRQAHGLEKSGTYRLLPGSMEKLIQIGALPRPPVHVLSPTAGQHQTNATIEIQKSIISTTEEQVRKPGSSHRPLLDDVQMTADVPITACIEKPTTPDKANAEMPGFGNDIHPDFVPTIENSIDNETHKGDVSSTNPLPETSSYFSAAHYDQDEECFSERSPGSWSDARHDCQSFNKQERLREIALRPKRKDMIGKSASFSRIGVVPILQPRAMQKSLDNDAQVADHETSGFGLPEIPMAVIHGGQLAFRDGTLNKDGLLPRAKVLLRPTPSKIG